MSETATVNPMAVPFLRKVVVNMGIGEGAEKLQRAEKVMASITGVKPVRTYARKAVREWGVREATPLGCKATLRGEAAADFLKRALWVRQHKIAAWTVDSQGNCSFGITDHTDFEGQKYDPDVGVFGMDISVILEKAGKRVATRRMRPGPIPRRHRVSREEATAFLVENFKIEVIG